MEEKIDSYKIGNPDAGSPDQAHVPTAPEAPMADACELSKTHSITHAPGNWMKDQKRDKMGLAPVSLSS